MATWTIDALLAQFRHDLAAFLRELGPPPAPEVPLAQWPAEVPARDFPDDTQLSDAAWQAKIDAVLAEVETWQAQGGSPRGE